MVKLHKKEKNLITVDDITVSRSLQNYFRPSEREMVIVTIDGPTASGKSSVAKFLAQRLGIHALNTGLLYRAVGYCFKQRYGAAALQPNAQGELKLSSQDFRMIDEIRYEYLDGASQIFYGQENITDKLQHDDIGKLSSVAGAHRVIRERLLPILRDIAKKYDVVADGRDCGTVIFPFASFKFYLTARTEVRAQRRFHDYAADPSVTLADVIKNLEERDFRDMTREIAPLVIPADAEVIDNSDLTLQETVEVFFKKIHG
jgi:cytidylate kinase